jgi:hypothetical protein
VAAGLLGKSAPILATFFGCCASAETQSAKSMAQRVSTVIFVFMFFPALSLDTPHSPPFSLNHSIRSRQHIGRNRKADLLGGLEIDDELKLLRLFYRQIGRLGTF